MTALLRINDLSKRFGNLTVLQSVNLSIYPGEVVGLAGRSGAGISTLIKLLGGLVKADSGKIFFDDKQLQYPFDVNELQIGIIHQQPRLVEQLDITSSIFLGNEIGYSILGDWLQIPNQRKMDEEAAKILAEMGVPIKSLHEKVSNLSNEKRQLVSIAQVLARSVRLVIIDDPTLLLTYPYQQKLLQLIRIWQQKGCAVLFNSQNLDHLFAVSDRVVVLRQGRKVADVRADETNREEIVAALVGTVDRSSRTPALWALDSYYQAREQAEALRHNQSLLQRDLAAQGSLNRQLVDKLADQVAALDSANLALQDAQRRLLTEREQERKHLARELHDQVIQDLLTLNYQLEEVEEQTATSTLLDTAVTPALSREVHEMGQHMRQLVEDVRRICGVLRPPTIDSLGLGAALQSYTREWSRRTGIQVMLHLEADFGRLPEPIELSIFRIVQESLNNVWKHAGASEVEVSLKPTSPRMLLISIADNGLGLDKRFNLASLSRVGHYGLLGISERVALMEGRLRFENLATGGLLLQVEVPHPRAVK